MDRRRDKGELPIISYNLFNSLLMSNMRAHKEVTFKDARHVNEKCFFFFVIVFILILEFRELARVVKAKLNALIVIIKVAKNAPTRIDRQRADETRDKPQINNTQRQQHQFALRNCTISMLTTY